jgi:hypothetical protein
MTAYVLSANTNVDALSPARTGGDTVDTNGFKFTIDQDTRYGVGGGAALSMGSMTINASKGGDIEINTTQVRQIAYTGGSGNVPAYGTVISQGGVSGKLIRVQSAINATPTAPAAAMPATGFITVKQVTGGAFAAGALTGISASATGADVAGFIELVGDELATINCNRLGTFRVRGDWFEVGSTSGSSATTYQLPTNGSVQYYPAVWVETAPGSGVYEPYPCAGSLVAAASTATNAVQGKVCWASTAGVLRFGSDGTNTVGYVPAAGCKIRIPNILTAVCTTAARGTNALPNATLATRYDFTTTGGGVIDIDRALLNWYPSISQAYSVVMTDVGISTQLSLSEVAQPMTLTRVCVGQEAANAQFGLSMSLCFAGGTITDCKWTSATLAASGRYVMSLTDISGFTFTRTYSTSRVARGNATTGSATLTRVANTSFVDCTIGCGRHLLTTCTNVTYTGTIYHDTPSAATGTTNGMQVWDLASNCLNITMSGLTFGGLTNQQPYNAILNIGAAGCANIKLRNIGTYASKLSLGSANQTGTVLVLAAGAAAQTVEVKRVYVANTRTTLYSGDNSSKGVLLRDLHGDYADAPVTPMLNVSQAGLGMTHAMTAQTACYGSHWFDSHTSTTAGRIGVLMNEPTTDTAAQVALTGGAAFTAAGRLYMPTIGMTATFTMPEYRIGHAGFQNSALVMAGGTAGNYTYAFQIDKNDGAGFSAWSAERTAAQLGTDLNALTGIDALKGFKLKLRITTGTTNTTAITSVYVLTTSTTTTQAYQYALDTATLTLTGLVAGSDVVVLTAGTETVLDSRDGGGTTYAFNYEGTPTVDIAVYAAGYIPYFIRGLALGTSNASLPVAQVADRAYLV